MKSVRLRTVLILFLVLALAALALAGGAAGCEKKKAWWGQGNGEKEEEVGGGSEEGQAEGPGRVAFVRDDHIYVAEYLEEGELSERRLTSSASCYGDLAFSPSGKQLAATKVEGDALPQLVIFDVGSGEETEVSWTNEDYSGAWRKADLSPWFGGIAWAGEDVLYCTAVRSEEGEFCYYVVKYDLSLPAVEIVDADACNPSLSPDGDKLAYVAMPLEWSEVGTGAWGTTDPGDLMVMDLANGEAGKVSVNRDGVERGYVFGASFSPDGKHMAVVCYDEPDVELFYTDLEGGILNTLDMVGPGGRISRPSFSRDGKRVIYHVAFRNSLEGPFEYTMFVAGAGTGSPEEIDLGEGRDPAWSPV